MIRLNSARASLILSAVFALSFSLLLLPKFITVKSATKNAATIQDKGARKDKNKDRSKDESTENGTPVLWREPTDIASRNLYLGPGGEAMKPDLSRITLIEEEKGGYSKKFRVRDGSGNEWVAKVGAEAQPETVAVRLLWAVGYVTEVNYLVPHVTIEGKGDFDNVRFEARPKGIKRLAIWKWDDNPFIGTREFQGLKVMMLLINNWDIKDDNNKILRVPNANGEGNELWYIISDTGASFGANDGMNLAYRYTHSRNSPKEYVRSPFIEKVSGQYVVFHYGGKRKDLFNNITIEQAKWIGDLLGHLTNEQLADAFRAANYKPEDAQPMIETLRKRISLLASINNPQVDAALTPRK